VSGCRVYLGDGVVEEEGDGQLGGHAPHAPADAPRERESVCESV